MAEQVRGQRLGVLVAVVNRERGEQHRSHQETDACAAANVSAPWTPPAIRSSSPTRRSVYPPAGRPPSLRWRNSRRVEDVGKGQRTVYAQLELKLGVGGCG